MYPKNMTIECFTKTVFSIFVVFMMRQDGWTKSKATEEWNFIIESGADMTSEMSPIARRDCYFEQSRKGASFPMTRRKRAGVMMTLENAINHASFSM